MIQYAVKALSGGVLNDDDEDLLMYFPDDGQESQDIMDDLRGGEGYGTDYVIVSREVGEWNVVPAR